MARKKIIVASRKSMAEPTKENNKITSLLVNFKREFANSFSKDLSYLLDDEELNNASLKLEIAKFVCFVNESSMSGETKKKYVSVFEEFVRAVQPKKIYSIISDEAIISFREYLNHRRISNEICDATYEAKKKALKALLSHAYSLDGEHFDSIFPKLRKRTGKISGSKIDKTTEGKAYTVEDFKEVTKLLIKKVDFFKTLFLRGAASEILDGMVFEYQQKSGHIYSRRFRTYQAAEPESYLKNQLMFYYMLFFTCITGMNQSPMLRLRRCDLKYKDATNGQLAIYITDHRKKKQKDPKPIKAKKRFRSVLDDLVDISSRINPDKNALLFSFSYDNGTFSSIPDSFISAQLNNSWVNSSLKDVNGNKIRIGTRKLRNSYGVQFKDLTTRAFVLGNSSRVADKYYSSGNSWDNNQTLQSGMYQYQESLLSKSEIYSKVSDERLKIPVSIIEPDAQSEVLKDKYSDNTPSGGLCSNNVNSEEALRNTRQMHKEIGDVSNSEIRCQSFLGCLRCAKHIFVNSAGKVYEILSLQAFLLNSRYEHEAGGLFGSKEHINTAIADIEWLVNEKFDSNVVEKARQKLEFEGLSPIWSIMR